MLRHVSSGHSSVASVMWAGHLSHPSTTGVERQVERERERLRERARVVEREVKRECVCVSGCYCVRMRLLGVCLQLILASRMRMGGFRQSVMFLLLHTSLNGQFCSWDSLSSRLGCAVHPSDLY